MNSRGKRMVQEDELTYLQELKAAHSDPSAEWGGGGSSLEAGAGIDITEGVLSVDYGAGLTVDDGTLVVDASAVAMKSELATVATTGLYSDLSGTPSLATVATTGLYSDLSGTPTIPAAVSGTNDGTNWTSLTVGSDTYAIPAGGSGSSYTFTNGLTESSGTVSWDLYNNIKKDSTYSGLIIGSIGSGQARNNSLVIGDSTGGSIYASADSLVVGKNNGGIIGGLQASNSLTVGYVKNVNGSINSGTESIVGGYCDKGRITGEGSSGSIVFGRIINPGEELYCNKYGCQVFGRANKATANYQMVIGKFSDSSNTSDKAFVIGNGTDLNTLSNAMTVNWDGVLECTNMPAVSGTDGTYQLTATTSSGTTTYSWAAGGSSSGKYLHKVQIFANYGGTSHIWTEDFVSSSATAYTSLTDYLSDRNYIITNTSDTLSKYMIENISGSNYTLAIMTGTTDVYLGTISVSAGPSIAVSWAVQTASAIVNDEVIAL